MKQFILNKEPENNIIRLEGKDYNYLVRVRRLAVGEFFPALLPDGTETLIKILSIDKKILTGECTKNLTQRHEGTADTEEDFIISSSVPLCRRVSLPPITLFQALPKGEKMDIIVRQAAEGGITEIVPFVSEFSIAKTNVSGLKFQRWERIIKEARQQSGSKIATSLHKPLTINELIDYWKKVNTSVTNALGLLFHHQGLEQESLHSYLNNIPDFLALAVGPEGGFSEAEVSLFLENGFKPLTIGDTILRTETAALYCAAAVKILLLEKNEWELKQPQNRKTTSSSA